MGNLDPVISNIAITHSDKKVFPDGTTKGEVLEYYARAAESLVPYLQNRAVSLLRSPGGINKGVFYQRHPGENFPDYIERVTVQGKQEPEIYITLDSTQDIIYLVNQGTIEFHIWGSEISQIDKPDFIVWDLDPDPKLDFRYTIDTAHHIQEVLNSLKLESFIKVSGGKGLHIFLPIKPSYSWETVKQFSLDIANLVCRQDPARLTTSMSKDERGGRIFIDYLRNTKGGTTVAPYSLRARHHAAISLPISWSQLNYDLRPDQFDIHTDLAKSTSAWKQFSRTANKLP